MSYEVGALQKSLTVLRCLADCEEPEGLGVSEIVRRTRLAKNMVFRICQTLVAEDWLEVTEPGPRYRLTLEPYHLFAKPLERSNVSKACEQTLDSLQKELGETVYVAVRDGEHAVNIAVREGSSPVRVSGALGSRYALHCCAQGKIFLAFSNEALKRRKRKAFTDKTITDFNALQKHIKNVQEQGYATNDEEFGRGLLGCAAPVYDHTNTCVAAIGVFAVSVEYQLPAIENTWANACISAGQEISQRLGWISSAE